MRAYPDGSFKRALAVVAVLCCVLLIPAVVFSVNGSTGAGAGAAGDDRARIIVTTLLSGTSPIPIAARTGDVVVVTIPSNRTTGYSWRLANQPNANVVAVGTSQYIAPGTGALGRGGAEAWTFRAVGRGTSTVVLEYTRPSERNTQPARRQVFSVTVQ